MQFGDEYFGSEAQLIVSKKAYDLWRILGTKPHFAYNGRIVTLLGGIGAQTSEALIALARLQGATTCHFLPKEMASSVENDINAAGLSSNVWEFCQGGQSAYEAAQKIISTHKLPTDITVEQLSIDSKASSVSSFAEMAVECGIFPMPGRVIRGLDVPGITLAGFDQYGDAVASAWGYKCYNSNEKYADYAFWGGLACRKDRRGQKIALILGAMCLVKLWKDMQVRRFCTGIAGDNAASLALCKKLELTPSDQIGLGVTDPVMFQGASMTK